MSRSLISSTATLSDEALAMILNERSYLILVHRGPLLRRFMSSMETRLMVVQNHGTHRQNRKILEK